MKNIIIHGATSFIGRNLVLRLKDQSKYNLVILARDSSNLDFCLNYSNVEIYRYHKELSDLENIIIRDLKDNIFFDFSWHGVFGQSRDNPEQLTVNIPLIISSIKLAYYLKSYHWVGIGSQAEYGIINKNVNENEICYPDSLYGKAKLLCSELVKELCIQYNIEYSWLRLFTVYGPNDNHEWFIPYIIVNMLKNRAIKTTKLEQKYDYLYIDDVIDALVKLIKSKGIGIANLSSGNAIQLSYIVEKIREFTQSSSIIEYGAIPYNDKQSMLIEGNNSKISNVINWFPKINIEDGLRLTIQQNQN